MAATARRQHASAEVRARPLPVGDPGTDAATLVLHLADLVPDAGGDIVLYNDSSVRAAVIHTDLAVVEEGRSGVHVTAAGIDVDGWCFIRFADGLRLYFPAELIVLPVRDDG